MTNTAAAPAAPASAPDVAPPFRLPGSSGRTYLVQHGRQGGRDFYATVMRNDVLNEHVSPDTETERAQRSLDPAHANDIADYIVNNPTEYAIGALIYTVDVAGSFTPYSPDGSVGLLWLPDNARMRSVDGQHRRVGITKSIDRAPWVTQDSTAILLYIEPDLAKRKQMFSDMNSTPRIVSKSVNVGFNSRDPFAQATNRLVASHQLLEGRVETERAWTLVSSEMLYALGSVYEAVRALELGPNVGRRAPRSASEVAVDHLVEQAYDFFTTLLAARPELQAILDDPLAVVDLRRESVLFNGTMLRVLAGATHLSRKAGLAWEQIQPGLASLDFSPSATIWEETSLVPPGTTHVRARNQEIRAATAAVYQHIAQSAR